MKIFKASSLEEVYELAIKEFNCSITNLDIEIIQQPSKGFLGFGKKNAIIQAVAKNRKNYEKKRKNNFQKKSIHIEEVSEKIEKSSSVEKNVKDERIKTSPQVKVKDKIFDNFYNEDKSKAGLSKIIVKKDKNEILKEIKKGVDSLFLNSCYNIEEIKVEFYDDETVYIEFTGKDCALLIGKEGYRYKALSYILFNWINEKYGLMLRLEVAQFLQNQEASINSYLEPVIGIIEEKGSFKTKPLDGILVHIALKRLREEFPNKYVAVKTNIKGDKYILVNEYRQKEV